MQACVHAKWGKSMLPLSPKACMLQLAKACCHSHLLQLPAAQAYGSRPAHNISRQEPKACRSLGTLQPLAPRLQHVPAHQHPPQRHHPSHTLRCDHLRRALWAFPSLAPSLGSARVHHNTPHRQHSKGLLQERAIVALPRSKSSPCLYGHRPQPTLLCQKTKKMSNVPKHSQREAAATSEPPLHLLLLPGRAGDAPSAVSARLSDTAMQLPRR